MKKLSTVAKILALAMTICVLFSLVSCFGGQLKLESFVVDGASIKTTYNVGDEVDFSGIKAYAKYSDESLNKTYTFADLTLTYDKDLTATAGKKTLVVSFKDPNLNVEQKAEVVITVKDPSASDSTDPQIVVGFQSPANVISFNGKNKDGSLEYGAPGFSGEFAKGGFTYLIGDDNTFKFLPELDTDEATLNAFYANVEMFVLDGEEYVALTKKATDAKVAAFYLGETLIADVNTYENTYDFTDAAIGKQVKISVMPSEEYYIFDGDTNAVVLEAKIIDAYNVTEAWQLAVIDNDTSRTDWVDIKNLKGIAGLAVAGIVLHNDIKVTAADLPASFFLTSTKDTVYTNSTDATDTKIIPAGSLYLKDWINVYQHVGAADFAINGNLFGIDVSAIPVIPSPGVFGAEAKLDYDTDFSNSTLFRFVTDEGVAEAPADVAVVTIENVSLIGNAKRDNYEDDTKALGFVGGLIFLKSSDHTVTTVNNVIGNSFFITYFAESSGDITANDVKCYDSYQNAAMVWAESTLIFNNSYLNGCGGPVVIVQSVVDDNAHPTFIANNTVIETHVTGQEIWFNAINAGGIITPIKALGTALHTAGLGNFADEGGKMNIAALLMKDGSDATAVVMNPAAQGTVDIDGNGIERWNKNGYIWQQIVNHPAYTTAGANGMTAPFLSVVDAQGNTHVLFTDGTYLYDMTGAVFAPTFDANGIPTNEHGWVAAAFATAEYITLSQGGISVVFEFYHYAN